VSSIYGITKNTGKIAITNTLRDSFLVADQAAFPTYDLNPTLRRFNEFWELMETVKKHGYIRAAMSVVGRSAVGAWWTLRRHPEYGKNAPDRHRKRLFNFYMYHDKTWTNIKDYQNFAYKLIIGAMYLRYFGQVTFQVVRDSEGLPLGLDHLTGLVIPNVDDKGNFKSPAFVQYPTNNLSYKVEFSNPKDIVYLINPDWEGSPLGGTDVEALTAFQLPIDIYLQTAAREYLKNRDKPEVVYSLPADVSDEAFDAFVAEVENRWRGPKNIGHSPIAVQGEFEVHELGKMPDSLPYQESRKETREEELAVTGVSGAKLGISDSISSANIREMRREFHETSMVPLFRLMEIGLYEQIHVREFNYKGWEFAFNSPDFLNAVERATVHMRYYQMNSLAPNEIRYEIGQQPRTDDQGDMYADQLKAKNGQKQDQPANQPGSPPEGRPQEPDAPSQTGEPTLDDQDPSRGDQHDETPKQQVIRELKTWKEFALRRVRQGRSIRRFNSDVIPAEINALIMTYVVRANTISDVARIFDEAIAEFEEAYDAEV
jgi:hypothetical protein